MRGVRALVTLLASLLGSWATGCTAERADPAGSAGGGAVVASGVGGAVTTATGSVTGTGGAPGNGGAASEGGGTNGAPWDQKPLVAAQGVTAGFVAEPQFLPTPILTSCLGAALTSVLGDDPESTYLIVPRSGGAAEQVSIYRSDGAAFALWSTLLLEDAGDTEAVDLGDYCPIEVRDLDGDGRSDIALPAMRIDAAGVKHRCPHRVFQPGRRRLPAGRDPSSGARRSHQSRRHIPHRRGHRERARRHAAPRGVGARAHPRSRADIGDWARSATS